MKKLKNFYIKNKLAVNIVIATFILLLAIVLIIYITLKPYFSSNIQIQDKPSDITGAIDIELPDPTINIDNNEENNDKIEDIQNSDAIYIEEQKQDEIINIVLSGVDTRSYDLNSRSDTIILASYNKTKHEVKLVSFMRDSWVYLPERGWQRINTATVYGGTGLLINTLNYNFDLDIQNYIQIKFDDFRKIIDILGGIEVELTNSEIRYINNKLHVEDHDYSNDIKADPGLINLNGTQALWHCRNRTIGNSDFERTDRQREVLTIIINKALSLNMGQATRMVFEMREHVNTNLDMELILNLASDALVNKNLTVETSRVPYDNAFRFANKNGASVLELDMDKNIELLHEFLGYELEKDDEVETDTVNNNTDS